MGGGGKSESAGSTTFGLDAVSKYQQRVHLLSELARLKLEKAQDDLHRVEDGWDASEQRWADALFAVKKAEIEVKIVELDWEFDK